MLLDVAMALGRRTLSNVVSDSGNIIAYKGDVVTETTIKQMSMVGIVAIEVECSESEMKLHLLDLIADEAQILELTRETNTLASVLLSIVDSDERITELLCKLADYDENTYKHCVRVAIEMGCIYMGKNKTDEEIIRATEAGLLHDIGKLDIPKHILLASRSLTESEFEIMKEHPKFSVERIKDFVTDEKMLNAIMYHHVQLDGSGYPKVDNYKAVSDDLQRTLHIVDIVDARLHTRCYKEAELAYTVINEMKDSEGITLDREAFEAAYNYMPIYRVGDYIRLEGGMICQVKKFNSISRLHSVTVRIIWWGNTKLKESVSGDGTVTIDLDSEHKVEQQLREVSVMY